MTQSPENASVKNSAVSYWNESSTGRKILIVVIIALIAALLVFGLFSLVNTLTGDSESGMPMVTITPDPGAGSGIIIPTPEPGLPSLTAKTNVNIRLGPSVEYPRVGILGSGDSALVKGRNAEATWWAIYIPEIPNETGWVADEYVITTNVENVPVLQAPPLPTPTIAPPVEFQGWKGEYYDNRNLQGEPVFVRDDAAINFDWGTGSPAPEIPADDFSVRWTNTRDVPAGTYNLSVWVDDGVRIWVDDTLVIDGWVQGTIREYTAAVNVVQGTHTVVVEYFEATGNALVQLNIGFVDAYPDWKGEYFSNPDVAGEPTAVRNDLEIAFNWGTGSPAAGIPPNDYSVRWSRSSYFEEGDYRFTIELEGGTRLWLDGRLLIDSWTSGDARTLSADSGQIGTGYHDLRMDYFKNTGNGAVRLTIAPLTATATPVPTPGTAPVAVIVAPPTGVVNQPITFIGDQSTPAEGSQLVTYEWAFGDGFGSNDINPTYSYRDAAVYTVILTVFDNNGLSDTTSAVISISGSATATPEATPPVGEVGPQAVITVRSPLPALVGAPVVFDGSASVAGSNQITAYEWNFGDGATATGQAVEHVYQVAGAYQVQLIVIDSVGLKSDERRDIGVTAEGPTEPTATPEPPTEETPTPQPTQPPGGSELVGGTWNLRGTFPDTQITALFDGSQVSGFAGCNNYSAAYQVDGSNMTIGALTKTGQTCSDGINDQEEDYLSALQQVTTYLVQGDQLDLSAGNSNLTYDRLVAAPAGS